MKVFVTGATGFIGSATVQELIRAGHQVTGLARSEKAGQSLAAAGARALRGDLQDLEVLKGAAAASDGVIHLGFIHDFSKFKENCDIDAGAISAMGDALAGSNKPFVITSGNAMVSPGVLATEDMVPPPNPGFPRVSEAVGVAQAARGIRASVVRLAPSVHGDGDHGFVPLLIGMAREKGVSAYIGEGKNRWNAVHRLDAAVLYRLALEKAPAGARYHGVGEEGVPFKDIAAAIGKGLNLPVESKPAEHFGWFAHFAGIDCPASSKLTQERLGWKPAHKTLLEDLAQGTYFKA